MRLLEGLIGLVTIAYPFLVWYSLDHVQPRFVALTLAGLFLLRLSRRQFRQAMGIWPWILPACAIFLLAGALLNQSQWLLAYPVFVNLAFFSVFALSLAYPPPIIERLARLENPDLPAKGVAYTRTVTQIWCVFFVFNGSLSLITIWYGEVWLWSLYNGFIAYVLMGLLMAGEMLVRRKVKARF
jgi:uncharacterized membrane protein